MILEQSINSGLFSSIVVTYLKNAPKDEIKRVTDILSIDACFCQTVDFITPKHGYFNHMVSISSRV